MPNKKHFFFDYASTAKIRFKISNCYESVDYPMIYLITTKRLNFHIPKCMTIKTAKYMYIPMDYYRIILTKYYLEKFGVVIK